MKNLILFLLGFLFSTSHIAQADEFAFPDIKSDYNFVTVKPGLFGMGSPEGEMDRNYDEQLHQVSLTRTFEIQKTPVTQEQYLLVMVKNPARFKNKEFCPETYRETGHISLCPDHPVESVSWNDAQAFIKKLNTMDHHYTYRLPTEAEWEYTARAKTATMFWFGDDIEKVQDFAWYGRNSSGQTQPVGRKPANPFGLYDVHGNVWEWTNDWYGFYSMEAQEDPPGFKDGVTKVLRGGSILSPALDLRAAARTRMPPQAWGPDIGFRLVRMSKQK